MIARTAVHGIPGADIAAITRVDGGRPYTEAATEELGRRIDELQYACDDGPCLRAARGRSSYLVPDLALDEEMKAFATGAVDAGVRSALAFSLDITGQSIGALNLYSRKVDGFGDSDVALGSVLSTYAAFVVARARLIKDDRTRISQLEEALKSRDVIGQAKGILMERETLTSDEAFATLRALSQHLNIKLREIAARFVSEVEERAKHGNGAG